MKLRPQDWKSEEEALEELDRLFPKGTLLDEIQPAMEHSGAKCYGLYGNAFSCRYVESSTTMVHVVWNLAFYVDSQKRLERTVVKRGLAGP